jgi:hypothetical protein
MDQGQQDITVTPELIIAQTIRRKFTALKAGLQYTFKVNPSAFIICRYYEPLTVGAVGNPLCSNESTWQQHGIFKIHVDNTSVPYH